jgi:hypothetical protein
MRDQSHAVAMNGPRRACDQRSCYVIKITAPTGRLPMQTTDQRSGMLLATLTVPSEPQKPATTVIKLREV